MRKTLLLAGLAVPLALVPLVHPAAAQSRLAPSPGLQAPPPEAPGGLTAGGGVQLGQLVRAGILPGWTTAQGTRMAALQLRLAPGWKTYFRIPGEAGIAPRFDWSESQNLAEVRIHWPRPEVFDQGGFRSIGYHDELVLPLELVPQRPDRPIVLSGRISIGVCDDICVPAELTVEAALRGEGAPDGRITAALATAARPAREAGLSGPLRCAVEPAGRGLALTLRATLPRQAAEEHMLIELPGSRTWVGDSRTWRDGGDLVARAQLRAPRGEAPVLDRSRIAVTILGGSRALEHRGCRGD
jgi:DsbC/DsbD-like thiol-disulfide interchange protein